MKEAKQKLNSTFTIGLTALQKKVTNKLDFEPVVVPLQIQNATSKIPRFKSNYSPLKLEKPLTKIDLNEVRQRSVCKLKIKRFLNLNSKF